jgi:guanylate kinase
MPKGNLFIVSGPSGAGKSTVCKIVRLKLGINLAVSATTRKPRIGEVNGREYHFLTKEQFQEKIEKGSFLEYANVHGNYYGTLKSEVDTRLEKGEDIILEIDVQGGIQVKEKYPDAMLVFFKTPTEEDLERRLRGRGTEDEETVQIRLKNSLKELQYEKYYDKTVVNYTIEQACEELMTIIKGEELEGGN